LLAQGNVLDKIAHHWRQDLSSISTNVSEMKIMLKSNKFNDTKDVEDITQELSTVIEQLKKRNI